MTFFEKYRWLIPMQLFIAGLLVIRIIVTHTVHLIFLPWNLFLGVIPLYFSYKLLYADNRILRWVYLLMWLLFFPNALYVITDIFHLKEHSNIPLWFDLLLLFSAAISGLALGFLSMRNVENFLAQKISRKYTPWIVLSFFILSAYGIYLGRYLRWNSWDIVTQPLSLLWDIGQDVRHPFRNVECWMLTGLFGTWLHLLYYYFTKARNIISVA